MKKWIPKCIERTQKLQNYNNFLKNSNYKKIAIALSKFEKDFFISQDTFFTAMATVIEKKPFAALNHLMMPYIKYIKLNLVKSINVTVNSSMLLLLNILIMLIWRHIFHSNNYCYREETFCCIESFNDAAYKINEVGFSQKYKGHKEFLNAVSTKYSDIGNLNTHFSLQ